MELNSELNLLKKTVFLSERELEEYQLRTEESQYEEPAQTWCLPVDHLGRTGGGGYQDILSVRKKHKRIRLNVGGDDYFFPLLSLNFCGFW